MSVVVILVAICAVVLWAKHALTKRRLPFPPGPPADPIIGHVRCIPATNQDYVFHEWSKTYGDVMCLHTPGQHVIILSSMKAAVDLLEKRSFNYSDRPRMTVLELMGFFPNPSMMAYGKRFQLHRRLFQEYLNRKKCDTYQHVQAQEALQLVRRLLETPEDHDRHFKLYSAATIIRLNYGHKMTSDDDIYFKMVEEGADALKHSGSPGSNLVDLIPALQYFPSWFPGAAFAQEAKRCYPAVRRMHDDPVSFVEKQMDDNCAKPSFVSHHLQHIKSVESNNPVTIEDIKGVSAAFYTAGSDTTWTTLSIFLLAMVLHPECQRKAQHEIDALFESSGQLPGFRDRRSLPYVECIVQECYRWNNAVPLGMPHRSLEDDVYRGMLIPKGSTVIANIRSITLDESSYSEPRTFNPDRYLPKPEGHGEPYSSAHFGFGRRICPGSYLADGSIWIAVVSILASFSIRKSVGDNGQDITPKVEFTNGITNHPKPYRCSMKPRNVLAQLAAHPLHPREL